jgi:putative hydrolase of the HAD superfamily
MIDMIALDADDTLWHNEILYARTQEKFQQLLSPYLQDARVGEELYQTEMQNLRTYGYGIKGFALSMIETAIRLSDGQIQASEIQGIIDLTRDMLEAPVQLLDHVEDVVATLSTSRTLMMITKGDLFDQERKIARSGLASHFAHVEIVSDKTIDAYRSLLARHQIAAQRFLMVGNSLRSDILPVVALGGHAVHIPYHITWDHEAVAARDEAPRTYFELEHIGLLPEFVERLCEEGRSP